MRVRKLETLVHITYHQFLFHCFAHSSVYFSVNILLSRMPKAVSSIHNRSVAQTVKLSGKVPPTLTAGNTNRRHSFHAHLLIHSVIARLPSPAHQLRVTTEALPGNDLLWMRREENSFRGHRLNAGWYGGSGNLCAYVNERHNRL